MLLQSKFLSFLPNVEFTGFALFAKSSGMIGWTKPLRGKEKRPELHIDIVTSFLFEIKRRCTVNIDS